MCFVNDGEYPPLKLTLTGTCASTPTSREVLHFQTFVRHKETKSIPISNRSNQQWDLRPIIDGNYWQGVHKFSVEPQSTKQYEITYSPMTMTVADNKKHTVSIRFNSTFYKIFFIHLILVDRNEFSDYLINCILLVGQLRLSTISQLWTLKYQCSSDESKAVDIVTIKILKVFFFYFICRVQYSFLFLMAQPYFTVWPALLSHPNQMAKSPETSHAKCTTQNLWLFIIGPNNQWG